MTDGIDELIAEAQAGPRVRERPLTDEADAFDRAARYLKRALPTLGRHAKRDLTAHDAMWALQDRAQALRQLARKAAR